MADSLLDTFRFRALIPTDSYRVRKEIDDWVRERFTPSQVQVIGMVKGHLLIVTEDDEELVVEIILRWNAKAERVDYDSHGIAVRKETPLV
jgi:hypothetical protein